MQRASILSTALALVVGTPITAAEPLATQRTDNQREAAGESRLFALVLRPGHAWRPGRPFAEQGLRPHFDYWMGLHRAGRIVMAGPMGSDSGLVLLVASDPAEAQEVMRGDPAIAAGIFVGEVRPYAPPMINAGALPNRD
jgi:uncharacterized protein YciI